MIMVSLKLENFRIKNNEIKKRKIKARSPSDYMDKFKKDNPYLDETMKTHLLDNLEEYGKMIMILLLINDHRELLMN